MMIKLDEMKLTSQQAMWVVFSRGKIVIQESSESIPVAYLSEIPFLASSTISVPAVHTSETASPQPPNNIEVRFIGMFI